MKKKLYIVFSVLTIICLFSVSAVCSQCSANKTEDKIDVGEESDSTDDTESDETKKDSSDSDATEKTDEGTTEESAEGEGEEPTIKLEIYEGPTYSAPDDICYYRIKAIVTGDPEPAVEFSKDDSGGAWGELKCQINIGKGETYTLTAKAKNSEGEDTATLDLSWGCDEEENEDPVIDEIVISDDTPVTDTQYTLSVDASDPDGDDLTYEWTVSGGSLTDDEKNPTKWTTPGSAGNYNIKVKVKDGNGGEDSMTITAGVAIAPPSIVTAVMPVINNETGYIQSDGALVNVPGCVYAGDSNTNKQIKGYVCFNISSLAGSTVDSVNLKFLIKNKYGNPSVLNDLYVNVLDWGSGAPTVDDFFLAGIVIQGFAGGGSGTFTCNAAILKTELQKAINDGKTKFKVRIHFSGPVTDSDGAWDGWEYDQSGIQLEVNYSS